MSTPAGVSMELVQSMASIAVAPRPELHIKYSTVSMMKSGCLSRKSLVPNGAYRMSRRVFPMASSIRAESAEVDTDRLTYKDSGVDIDAGSELVKRIAKMAPGVGGFGGLFPPVTGRRAMKSGISCVKEAKIDSEKLVDQKAEIRRKNLAVFVSGGGSNFKSLHEAIAGGVVHGDIVVVVTNKPDCGGAEYARDKGIPVILFPKGKDGLGLSSNNIVNALRRYSVDFILLAGFLKIIPVELIQAFPRSILNIHPSLLPAFGGKGYYGIKVHRAVIASGARFSGPTIHYVDGEYDRGRILAQRIVPVLTKDTAEELAGRILHEEHKLYKEVVAALCEERIIWREDGVPLIRSRENPEVFI